MRQILLTVPDEQYAFLMKVLKSFAFEVEAKPVRAPKEKKLTPAQQEWVDEMKEALEQVELHQQGKIKLRSLDELIDEL
ncbi:hypothetical protein J0X19_07565 [Hymenobacter sp. BT186]|uniref:Uncharacterized protein n=1 Tax=Hymenobacter telluris TaxID=2816474 RepID=A0A939EVA3_9BACT|nr:hypothetical protein [Hymenobacter telluris]MBO0357799.1 hypothetical protein [Hymenobacter telluris]MBW3373826.1 hypothetical protein [Hymenobacter norwichensis]